MPQPAVMTCNTWLRMHCTGQVSSTCHAFHAVDLMLQQQDVSRAVFRTAAPAAAVAAPRLGGEATAAAFDMKHHDSTLCASYTGCWLPGGRASLQPRPTAGRAV